MPPKPSAKPNETRISRFLHVVEWLGNPLPHPVTLFALFAAGVVVLSGILGYFDVAVVDPADTRRWITTLLGAAPPRHDGAGRPHVDTW